MLISKEEYLHKAHEHAKSKGGLCLSTEYKNAKTKLDWQCKNNHVWQSDYDHAINRDRWCKQCSYDKSLDKKFDVMAEEYAKNKGGSVILPDDRKVKTATMLTWKCANTAHKPWISNFRNIAQKGGWCPYCAGKFSKEEYLEKAKEYAISKGWQCISKEYIDQSSQLIWSCHKHGSWSESYSSLVNKSGGCKKCREQLTPEEYLEKSKQYAISQGGKCLSTTYKKQSKKLIWNCHEHGNWESSYGNIVINNRWCPTCFKEKQKSKMLEDAYIYARSLNGRCMTNEFNSVKDMFEWKCQNESHPSWKTRYDSVFTNKSWCPECGIYYQKENQSRKLLEYLLGFPLEKAKPKWNINPSTGNLLELDGYNEENKIAFEYQGRHHYEDNVFKNANQSLEIVQFKDKIKSAHCEKQGITLIIIDGRKKRDTSKRMINYLKEILNSHDLKYKIDINLDEVENIYNAARIEKCDNSKAS